MAAKGKGVVIYVLFGAGAVAGTGVPSQSLPFQKVLLELQRPLFFQVIHTPLASMEGLPNLMTQNLSPL